MTRDWTQAEYGITGNEPDAFEQTKAELSKLKQQLAIAVEALKAVLHDEFILEHADAGLIMYLTQAEYKIKELEK